MSQKQSMSRVILGANQYCTAENLVVRIHRETDRHVIGDLLITSQLRGDFEAVHTEGDNAHCVATDTQKQTIFAFVQQYGVDTPEQVLMRLSDHFTSEFDWVTGGRWAAEEQNGKRINDHDHCFVADKTGTRAAVVVTDGDARTVISGFHGLTVLKPTDDRIMSTDVATR